MGAVSHGFLVALEGIDGSGTTSQGENLKAQLEARGHRAHLTCEPSSHPIGQLIRQALRHELELDPATLALLFAADRLDHLQKEIEPEIRAGSIVITDRYLLSSLAYQGTDNPLEWVATLNSRARRPDLTALLRVSVATSAARRDQRGGESELFEADAQQQKIAALYETMLARDDIGKTVVIDAEADFDTVAGALWGAVMSATGRSGSS